MFPPPFNTLCYLGQFIKYIYRRCTSLCKAARHNLNTGKTIHALEIFMMIFLFIEKPSELSPSVNTNTVLSSDDTRQINREKVIAESYWQPIFDEEKQNKM
jgi:hypothetical protein